MQTYFQPLLSKANIWWSTHKDAALKAVSAILIGLTALRLGYEYWRLLLNPEVAVDLGIQHPWVHTWFAGGNIYSSELVPVVYPVASYVLLWPILGWLAITPTRWFFGLVVTLCLAWLIYLLRSESPLNSKSERRVLILFVLALYATGITIGNGQLTLFILPTLLYGLLLLFHEKQSWRRDLVAALVLLFTLVKPPISAPFFLIVLLVKRAYRVIILVTVGYLALTAFALSFQNVGLEYFKIMSRNAAEMAIGVGYGSINSVFNAIGLGEWRNHASAILVVLLAIWLHCNRDKDFWLLLGVTALIARMWTYHRLYDDLLILIPLVTLLRISRSQGYSENIAIVSGLILLLSCLGLLIPGTLYRLQMPLGTLCRTGQTLLWSGMLAFLIYVNRHDIQKRTG